MATEELDSHRSHVAVDGHQLQNLNQEIALAVAGAATIETAFTGVLNAVCRFTEWPLGHVYVWSKVAEALVSSRIWYMADPVAFASFRDSIETKEISSGNGIIGKVHQTGAVVIVPDADAESELYYDGETGKKIGAHYAFPVAAAAEVVAVVEFFAIEPALLDGEVRSTIEHACALLGLSIAKRQTVAHLQRREEQLVELQKTAHVGHWEWDLQHNQVTWSPELYRIFGIRPESFAASYEGFIEHVHPDDRQYVEKKVRDAYQHGHAFDYFHRVVRPDGSIRVIHARGRPMYDRAGLIAKLYGTVQDMTEQKETELKLARTVRQLSALMEIGQTVSATLDLSKIYEEVLTLIRPLLGAEAVILFLYCEEMLEIVALDREDAPDMRGIRVSVQEGVAGAVWRNGHSLFLQGDECLQQLAPQVNMVTGYRPASMLAVPVRWREERIGVLEAVHRDADAFRKEDLQILETAAAWTAIAISNARQYERLQRRLRESDAIAAVTNALTETLELDNILQLITKNVQQIIARADWTTIHLLSPNETHLALAASAGLNVSPDAYRINLGEGIAGLVVVEGGVLNIADVQTDPRRLPIDQSTQARSMLVAPVESRRRRIGAISVQCATPATFTAADERLLTILGVQAGMAIENARLFAAQRDARKLAEERRERMRQLAQRVVEAQEEERARIARELHDESGQALTSIKISLDLMRSLLPPDMKDVQQGLEEILDLTDKTMSNLRLLSHNLRPPGLDAYGLDAALSGLCHDFETHTPLTVNYEGSDLSEPAPMTALSLYRVAQEALTNVAKHAAATEVLVTLRAKPGMVVLTIADNGLGFVPPELETSVPAAGAGLVGMLERLEMVNGRLRIESAPGEGSRLTATVPVTVEES